MGEQKTCWCSNCNTAKTRDEVDVKKDLKGGFVYICKKCMMAIPPPITETKRKEIRSIGK